MKLEKIQFFPVHRTTDVHFKHRVIVGIGGNEGNVKRRFVKLYRFFQNDRRFFITDTSSVFQNPPFGYLDQADFYNGLLVMKTSRSAKETLKRLLHVEAIFGRVRSIKNGPRTLDLDIIFFDNKNIKQKDLMIPHPKWAERLSVRVPLAMLNFKGLKW